MIPSIARVNNIERVNILKIILLIEYLIISMNSFFFSPLAQKKSVRINEKGMILPIARVNNIERLNILKIILLIEYLIISMISFFFKADCYDSFK